MGFCLAIAGPVGAADDDAVIVVAGVAGPLEQRAIDFLTEAVRTPDAALVVLQLDNPGVASGDIEGLYAAIAAATVPVTVWVGPGEAEALGGVGRLVALAAHSGATPGARIGYLDQPVAGGPVEPFEEGAPYGPGVIVVDEPVPGFVDTVAPTLLNFIADLDGQVVESPGTGVVTLDTIADSGDGEPGGFTHPLRLVKPGLVDRTLRLAIRPEAAFFFFVTGLVMVAFEFYTLGAGIAAGVGVICLFLAGFGIASLPMRWWALAAVVAGVVLYTADLQGARVSWRGVLGTAFLLGGGLAFIDGAPQMSTLWWVVVLVVATVAAFYMVAMTTVVRSRLSTRTIGREHLVGRRGVAETGFDPMGVVDVDGARWRGRSHRAAGIAPGDPVEILSVSGIMLEVGPVDDAG